MPTFLGMSDTTPTTLPENIRGIIKDIKSSFSHTEHLSDLIAAFALAQANFKPADQGANNPHYKKNYSDLADVWDVARDHLGVHGIVVFQFPVNDPGSESVTLITSIHCKEDWIRGTLTCKVPLNDPQKIGSAITYLRRYTLSGALGIVSRGEDDDGEGANGRSQPAPAQQQRPAPAAPAPAKPATTAAAKPVASTTPAAEVVPEAAKMFVKRFDECQSAEEFHSMVGSTKTVFDDGTPEKLALSHAIKRAAARLKIEPKRPAPAQGATS